MAMVGVVSGSLYRRAHSLSRLAWSWVGGRLAPFYIHQMNRVNSRKSRWLCHDDSTINIVVVIIIIIIIIRLHHLTKLYTHTVCKCALNATNAPSDNLSHNALLPCLLKHRCGVHTGYQWQLH